jgi:hypothetical protein
MSSAEVAGRGILEQNTAEGYGRRGCDPAGAYLCYKKNC